MLALHHINDGIVLCTATGTTLQYYKPVFFGLNSYADSITIKDKRNAIHKLDEVSTPLPPPTPFTPVISHDDDEYDFTCTSSSEDDFTSDDE